MLERDGKVYRVEGAPELIDFRRIVAGHANGQAA